MWKNKKGFTAIELILFIIVMGVLSYMSITKYQNEIKKSRLAEAHGIMYFSMANTDLYLSKKGTPKKPILFTGKNKQFNGIELPGNCSTDENSCQTEFWFYESNCQPNLCTITIKNKGWLPGGDIVITLDTTNKSNPYQISKVGDGNPAALNYLCPFLQNGKLYYKSPAAIQACEK